MNAVFEDEHGRGGKDRIKKLLTAAVGSLLVSTILVVVSPTPASAEGDGLTLGSQTTFRLDPANEQILVEATYTVTNVSPNRTQGNQIIQYYFEGVSMPIPPTATDLVVTGSNGRNLVVSVDSAAFEDFSVADVRFARNLFYRGTATFTLSYSLPSGEVRDELSYVRVNPAYAVFEAWGYGDENRVDVRVEIPETFSVDVEGSVHESWVEDGVRIYEATDIADPSEFFLFIIARNDDALEQRTVELEDQRQARVLSWPGDTEWADFVESQLTVGLPILEEMVGLEFPDDDLEIVESIDPWLLGYAGWYIQEEQRIEASEELDPNLILHEISHAWFTYELFDGRWITEGLANEFSSQAAKAGGETLLNPDRPATSGPGAVDLNRWTNAYSFGDQAFEREDFGYNASWYVMRQLSDEIGIEGLARVIWAADQNLLAYVGEADAEPAEQFIDDWRRFLDLAEEAGGSEEATALFANYVLTSSQAAEVELRDAARAEYQDLVSLGGEWAAPLVVREAMGGWRFDEAGVEIRSASALLDRRDALVQTLQPLNLTFSDEIEIAYQEVAEPKSFSAVWNLLGDHQAAAESLVLAEAATASERSVLEQIGLWGTDLSTQYADSRLAFEQGDTSGAMDLAEGVVAGFDAAGSAGNKRVWQAAAGLVGLIVLGWVLVRYIRWWRQASRLLAQRTAALIVEPTDQSANQPPPLDLDAEDLERLDWQLGSEGDPDCSETLSEDQGAQQCRVGSVAGHEAP